MPAGLLTLFAVPKAFTGATAVIQRNAITSWTRLIPRPDVILLGNDPGTAEMAGELGLKHVPEVERTRFGTPLIDSIFACAETYSQTPWLAYINADCILLDDFSRATRVLKGETTRLAITEFLLCSQRVELDLVEPIPFDEADWAKQLKNDLSSRGVKDFKTAVEMFFFTRGFFTEIPPFAIGRPCWDNWMLWKALDRKGVVIDASEAFQIIHQCHDYGHVDGGWRKAWKGEEASQNLYLSQGRFMSINNVCNHVLTPEGLFPGFFIPDQAQLDPLLARRITKGMDEMRQGRFTSAIDYLNDAEERSSEGAPIESLHLARAICWIHLQEYGEARKALEKELAAWPDNAEAAKLMGQLTAPGVSG